MNIVNLDQNTSTPTMSPENNDELYESRENMRSEKSEQKPEQLGVRPLNIISKLYRELLKEMAKTVTKYSVYIQGRTISD